MIENNEKGISLLALVVTITVLAILAGVSIVNISGKNGVLQETTRTIAQTKITDEMEMINRAYANAQMNKASTDPTDSPITSEEFLKEMKEITSESVTATGTGTLTVTFTSSGRKYTINTESNVSLVID